MSGKITEILMKEIDSLVSGKSDIDRANSVAKLSAQVIYKERLGVEKASLAERIKKRVEG